MSSHPSSPTVPGADSADSLPLPRARTLFARALRLRCPVCGGGPIRLGWVSLVPSCPVCGLHLDRGEPGYWIGSWTINLFVTEGVFAAVFAGALLLAWPALSWTALAVLCIALAILTPVLVFPYTKLLFLALDLAFRPPEPRDLESPPERGLVAKRR